MKDKIFGVLQRVGRSFMLPIALLPIAGILLGLGSVFTNETTLATYHLTAAFGPGTFMHGFNTILPEVLAFPHGFSRYPYGFPRHLSLRVL